MANNMISIKIEGEEDQVLQFTLPEPPFGVPVVNGILDEHFAGNEDIASLLGNPSSESLTMYKSEPMEQEEEQPPPEFEKTQTVLDFEKVEGSPGSIGEKIVPEKAPVLEESSSSSSNSDDENSSASDGDNDSSVRSGDERERMDESEESRGPLASAQRRKRRNEKNMEKLRIQRIKGSGPGEMSQRLQESQAEKTVENFVHDNIEEYLNRRGFRHPMTVPTTISKGIFASIILPEAARMNTVAFGPEYDIQDVMDGMERFWKFYTQLKDTAPTLSLELRQLLIPTLLYYFQDACIMKIPEFAKKLHGTFSKRFFQEDRSQESYLAISNLSRIINAGFPEDDEYLQNIHHRESRFIVSERLFEKLKEFLVRSQSPVLTHLFTSKFVIQIEETASVTEAFLEAPSSGSLSSFSSPNESDKIETNISISYSSSPFVKNTQQKQEKVPLPPEFRPILFDKTEGSSQSKGTPPKNHVSPTRKAIYMLRNSVEANIPSIRLYTLSGHPVAAAVSKEGTLIAFGMSTSAINVAFTSTKDLNRFNMERLLEKNRRHEMLKNSRHNRKRHFTATGKGPEHLEDTNFENLVPLKASEKAKVINSMFGHEGPVYDLVFHPKTRILFSVGHDATLRAWDLNTFKCRCVYRGHASPIWCIDITDSGHMIVTGSMDTSARIWIPEKTEYVRLLAGHYFDVDCVKFHPNEAYVATGSVDKSVRMWSVADGNLVRVFTGATSGLSAISFHESGKYIIGGGEDSFIHIWDIAEGEIRAELPSPIGSSSSCRHIALCQNMLAAAFEDNTVRIWNLRELFGGNERFSLDRSNNSSSSSDTDEEDFISTSFLSKSDERRRKRALGTEVEHQKDSSEWETVSTGSSCSFTEDELEPIETNVSSNAVRLPAPKIIHCDSSSILSICYRDFGHLYTLGSQKEDKDEAEDESIEILNSETVSCFPFPDEHDPSVVYLPESLRPALIAAGIQRWPIPIEKLSSSEDEEESGKAEKGQTKKPVKSAVVQNTVTVELNKGKPCYVVRQVPTPPATTPRLISDSNGNRVAPNNPS